MKPGFFRDTNKDVNNRVDVYDICSLDFHSLCMYIKFKVI